MSSSSGHLQYRLSRLQRLVPLLRIEGVAFTLFSLVLFSFFSVEAILCVCIGSWLGAAVMGGLALGVFVLSRGLAVGLLDVLFVPVRRMDVVLEEEAAGFLIGNERWYLFLDGILELRK